VKEAPAVSAARRPPSALPAPRVSLVSQHRDVVAAHRRSSLGMALLGALGVLLAPLYLATFGPRWSDALVFLVFYELIMGAGLCVGYHRHFSHGAFSASPRVRACLAALGAMGGQGPLIYWVSVHRRHHEHGDAEGDPHSPNQHGRGRIGTLRGLWHGHFGWSLGYGMPSAAHYCPDLLREPRLVAISRHYRAWVVLGLVLPALAGGLLTWTWSGALGGFLWGGLVRLFLSSNSTWSLNSICHRFGTRPFATRDASTNVGWLALPTLGESWHNNHHAHPSSAAHGLSGRQLDLNYQLIRLLEALHLVRDVRRAPGLARTPVRARTGSR